MEVISTGTGESTIGGPHHVVLPLKAPISGPNSLLAMSTSHGVTGQLGRLLAFRIWMKSLPDGRPTVTCNSRALIAWR